MQTLIHTYQASLDWLYRQFFIQKLNTPLGYVFIATISLALGLGLAMVGLKMGIIVLAGILAIPVVIACFISQQFGLAICLVIAFLIQFINKFGNYPAGLALDGLVFFMFFAVFVKQIWERDWSFANHWISGIILIWVAYSVMQVLNPAAASRMAWVFTVRSLAGLIILYFVACYAFKSLARIKWMLKFIIFLALLSALYGLKQEFIGFSQAELNWLYADEERFQLIVQWNRFRVFSLFSDPTTFGIVMAYCSVFCIVLATGSFKIYQRIALIVGAILMIMSMGYGGSRTPVLLVPAGLVMFVLLTMKKEVLIGAGIFFVLGTAVMMKGSSNPVLFRIQSAFKPTEDASVQVRLDNQKKIQPFLQSHPFGGGLGRCGVWGKRFSPHDWLASFAHDSGFVRIAVEMGWVGLILYMVFLFKILQTGIYYYFRVRNPEIKTLYLALTCLMFILMVASYPQEAIVLLPNSIIFYICLAAIVRLKDFDDPDPVLSPSPAQSREILQMSNK